LKIENNFKITFAVLRRVLNCCIIGYSIIALKRLSKEGSKILGIALIRLWVNFGPSPGRENLCITVYGNPRCHPAGVPYTDHYWDYY
jgi:hypothetical protein